MIERVRECAECLNVSIDMQIQRQEIEEDMLYMTGILALISLGLIVLCCWTCCCKVSMVVANLSTRVN